ncbi:hypothetical protein CK203_036907 [Vitis vinifera]|uniref:Uncharacterized protein n=1 Tax=Vitis vinifera TaxID=29760 RepID=A0A438IV07_VITVI|nr:hypothetical protein CK203_036907 [Vitis vinifera]
MSKFGLELEAMDTGLLSCGLHIDTNSCWLTTSQIVLCGVGDLPQKETQWRRVIVRKFGEEGGGWTSGVPREGYGVGFWKAIRKNWEVFQNKVGFIVGNGNRIKF